MAQMLSVSVSMRALLCVSGINFCSALLVGRVLYKGMHGSLSVSVMLFSHVTVIAEVIFWELVHSVLDAITNFLTRIIA